MESNYDEKIVKKYLLQTMETFHSFCEENNLSYFIVGGTFLGAVRHKGLIPWDDDIDVLMPREDYNRLLSISEKINLPYQIKDIEKDDKYIYPYAKFASNDLIVEEAFYKNYQMGIWVDVFPLDYTFKNKFLRRLHFSIVAFFRNLSIIKVGSFQLKKYSSMIGWGLRVCHRIFKIIPKKIFFKIIEWSEKMGKLGNKEYVANLHGNWGVKESVPASLFDEKVLYSFEDKEYWGIKDYDYWLTQVYGDYMTLPEESKRVREHIGTIVSIK